MHIRSGLLCLSLVILPMPAASQTPSGASSLALPPAAQEAAAATEAFHRALSSGDLQAASSLLASDALIYESGGVERGKAEYASHHLPADAAFAKATKRTVTRRTGNALGDLAWIATESTTTGTYKGRVINSRSTETMVLRHESGVWRIAHVHWSSANVK